MKVWDFDAHKGPSEIFHLRYPGNRGGRDCIKLVEWVERYFATYGQGRKSNLRQMSEAVSRPKPSRPCHAAGDQLTGRERGPRTTTACSRAG